MAQVAPSSEMLAALGFALVLILLAALFLYFNSPLLYSLSLSTPSKKAPKAESDAMAHVLIPSPIHTAGLEAQSLLDLSSPEQFDFPALEPQVARGTGLAASNFARDPIIREGSPIDLATETINGSGRNDENIQYRPGSVNDVEKQPFEIHWALGCSVFDNRAEEVSAARHPGNIIGRPVTENMFFQYGLRYIPPATSGDLYRTVLIERLPHGVSLGQILPRIRGGRIYSASLCNTSSITKHWTALIVFLHETGASAFLRRVAQEGLFIGFTAVSVRRVPTPTYLIHPAMMQGAQYSRTRCLGVCSPEPMFRMAVHRVLANSGLGDQVECFGEHDPSGATSIRFHSIKAAARAFEVLLSSKTPKLIVKYVADPCSL